MPVISSIIHAAGIDIHETVRDHTWQHFTDINQAKVIGAWNLHRLSLNLPVTDFILFSSMSSMMGSPRQLAYSTGNAFLDGLAYYRQQSQLPVLCINWGVWGEIGMGVDAWQQLFDDDQALISPHDGLNALEFLLQSDENYVGVVTPIFMEFMLDFIKDDSSGFYHELLRQFKKLESDKPTVSVATDMSETDITATTETTLRDVLGMSEDDELRHNQGFFDLGMDSVRAVEFRNKLMTRLPNIDIPTTVAFDYASLEKLNQYLIGITSTQAKSIQIEPESPTRVDHIHHANLFTTDEIEMMSAQELIKSFDEMLNEHKGGENE